MLAVSGDLGLERAQHLEGMALQHEPAGELAPLLHLFANDVDPHVTQGTAQSVRHPGQEPIELGGRGRAGGHGAPVHGVETDVRSSRPDGGVEKFYAAFDLADGRAVPRLQVPLELGQFGQALGQKAHFPGAVGGVEVEEVQSGLHRHGFLPRPEANVPEGVEDLSVQQENVLLTESLQKAFEAVVGAYAEVFPVHVRTEDAKDVQTGLGLEGRLQSHAGVFVGVLDTGFQGQVGGVGEEDHEGGAFGGVGADAPEVVDLCVVQIDLGGEAVDETEDGKAGGEAQEMHFFGKGLMLVMLQLSPG
mmetsp:Transcript_16679/g.37503  ORF Transcript_16679/g.37503 Transcript_16679/m.37503 type:complete len:304 (+) Transcript_16679:5988-6899(+)